MEASPNILRGATRRTRIVDLVRESGYYRQSELADLLGVSEMTIRRDSRRLAAEGLVHAQRGGLSKVDDALVGTDFRLRAETRPDAKRRIAEVALRLVRPGATIALDAGTTTLELARLLAGVTPLTVVTASLPAMIVLADHPGIQIHGLGGLLHVQSQAFAGPATIDSLKRLHIDQVFLGASAVGRGAMWCGNAWDSEIKRSMIDVGDEVILLVDAAKCQATAMACVASLSTVGTVVVDDGISSADLEAFRAAGVRVVIAPMARDAHPGVAEPVMEAIS